MTKVRFEMVSASCRSNQNNFPTYTKLPTKNAILSQPVCDDAAFRALMHRIVIQIMSSAAKVLFLHYPRSLDLS